MSSKRSKQGQKKKATDPSDKRSGHSKALTPPTELRELARLRVGHVMELFALSHSSLYKRMQSGAIPRPDGYDGKRPYWRVSTIRRFLEEPQ
jgi:predicted DNA-binding transcriptional regulator AlpA